MSTKHKVIIYAGVNSSTYDTEAEELKEALEAEGYEIIKIIPINGLECPRIEYLKKYGEYESNGKIPCNCK